MGKSTFVVGYKEKDDMWHKMVAAYNACDAANVPIPEEVDNYFGGCVPDDYPEHPIKDAVRVGGDDSSEWIDVDISKLSDCVKIVRFVNSW